MGFGLSIWRSFDGIYFRLSNTYIVPKWNHPFEDTLTEHISDYQTHLYCSQIMGLSIWGYFDGTYFRLSNTYYISCFKFYIVGLSTKKNSFHMLAIFLDFSAPPGAALSGRSPTEALAGIPQPSLGAGREREPWNSADEARWASPGPGDRELKIMGKLWIPIGYWLSYRIL